MKSSLSILIDSYFEAPLKTRGGAKEMTSFRLGIEKNDNCCQGEAKNINVASGVRVLQT